MWRQLCAVSRISVVALVAVLFFGVPQIGYEGAKDSMQEVLFWEGFLCFTKRLVCEWKKEE